MNNKNNNKGPELSMQNIPGTPPPKKYVEEEVNYNKYINNTSNGLINPFRTDLLSLIYFCYAILDSLKNKELYVKYAFSGSFAVYLYKLYLKNRYPQLEIDMNSWKPKDIDIIVDKNLTQLRKGMSEMARSSYVKHIFGQNASVTGTEQIIQFNEFINGYKMIKIDIVPESAGKGDLKRICYLKYLIDGKEYKLPVLPFDKILQTKREQLQGYPSTSMNEKIRNKHNRVVKHIKNLENMNSMKNKLQNINCENNNSKNNNSKNNNSIKFNLNNNNNNNFIIRRRNNKNNNNDSFIRRNNKNNNNNSFIRRSNEMTLGELNNSQTTQQQTNQTIQGSPPKRARKLF